MSNISLPSEVEAVFHNFLTCEFTTVGKDGTPITWPILPLYRPDPMQFVILTSIGLPQKALNVRRTPQVSLLFSEPTGSDLKRPPTVLVQGDATAPDDILYAPSKAESWLREAMVAQARKVIQRQPAVSRYTANPLMRRLMDWYYMRLAIYVTPKRIIWWEGGDGSRAAHQWEVAHVA